MAFHPRPRFGSQRHPQLQPAPKSQPIPEWERNFGLWPQIQIAAGLIPLRFENRKPNPPLFTSDLNSSNRKPAGRNRRIRAARWPQIAESPATRPQGFTRSLLFAPRENPHFRCGALYKNEDVLNGVGVDGVGGIFPFFTFFFRFSSFFFVFLRFSSLLSHSASGQGRTTAIYCKNGEFHSDPVCTDPVRNFPIKMKMF